MRPRPTLMMLLAIAACRGENPSTTVDPDPSPLSLLLGTGRLVQHLQWAAFMPRELPGSGLYRVTLRRQIAEVQAPR